MKNLIKHRKEKTPLTLENKKIDPRPSKEIALKEYDFKVGDLFLGTSVNKWFELYRISEITERGSIELEKAELNEGIIEYILKGGKIEGLQWRGYGSSLLEGYNSLPNDINRGEYTRIKSLEEVKQYIKEFEENISDLSKFDFSIPEESNETSLAIMDQNLLKSMSKLYRDKASQIQLLEAIARYKMKELSIIKNKFMNIVNKIHKVIGKIELYLGVNEDVVQIQDGETSPVDTPISLFQRILYMDEEVGVVEEGGLDWKHIDDFDNWLIEGHLDLIAPLPKCIVILKVRRKDKYYSSNVWDNKELNRNNNQTYILIRNGDKVYRIYTNLIISPRLFPGINEIEEKIDSSINHSVVDDYHNHFLILQGIIDRSDLLWPLPHKIDIFNEETWKGMIQLIRDDENVLDDGRVTYKKWKEKLNSHNKVGSRVVYSGVERGEDGERRIIGSNRWIAGFPPSGVYNLKRLSRENSHYKRFVFWYNPEDLIYDWGRYTYGSHKRKKAVGFEVDQDDYCIINYDMMKLEDIDFYLNCRQERHHYLDLIPLLKQLKKMKLKELEEEKGFKELIIKQLNVEKTDLLQKVVEDVIEWWKMKVIEKRPLMREDKKAMRMILGRVKKELYNIE